ncbi:putative CCAAT-binding factor complex subunit HapE [Blumeria hordei DH14]|uniref:Putative CCAAT-binding factor complex subunit HapE n=1 Tax=Blumeria graminis f. sp. hordei (strain DH14) TaxID=546991 RepID=N1JHY8_BLUG1|nr:putative CCAAT-binding factor complex subunit HapE [Blumeria hordei DH14]
MESTKQTKNEEEQGQQHSQPAYDVAHGGHYGASASLSGQGYAPVAEFYTGIWANVNQGLHGNYKDILTTYWQHTINHLETENHDYKVHQLPLARIKKVMKADPDVKMISAEAPIMFAKGCDIFITELTMRAWIHAEENKRRTLQRSDIASALCKSDMFDFLIDIVPREDLCGDKQKRGNSGPVSAASNTAIQQLPVSLGTSSGYADQIGVEHQDEYALRDASFAGPGPATSGQTGYGGSAGQIYSEIGSIYGFPPMPPPQIFQVSSQQQQLSRPILNLDSQIGSDSNAAGHESSSRDEKDLEGEGGYVV